jgi:hypothetical protein
VKPATVRTVLTLAHSRHWPIHQLDVKVSGLKFLDFMLIHCIWPDFWIRQ